MLTSTYCQEKNLHLHKVYFIIKCWLTYIFGCTLTYLATVENHLFSLMVLRLRDISHCCWPALSKDQNKSMISSASLSLLHHQKVKKSCVKPMWQGPSACMYSYTYGYFLPLCVWDRAVGECVRYMHMHTWVLVPVHAHAELIAGCLVSTLITLHLIACPSTRNSSWLWFGQQALGVCLSLPQCWGSKHMELCPDVYMLGIQTQLLMLQVTPEPWPQLPP